MIVICTYNGKDYLPRLLNSMHQYGTDGEKVVICDNHSTDPDSLDYLVYIEDRVELSPIPDIIKSAGPNYDTGGYLSAYKQYPNEDYYMFMHDSMEVKDPNWLKQFKDRIEGYDAVAWHIFHQGFDNEEQHQFCTERIGDYWKNWGIFGPILYISNHAMKTLAADLENCLPTNKNLQQAMERGWAMLFEKHGLKCNRVHTFDIYGIWRHSLPGLNKFLPTRG